MKDYSSNSLPFTDKILVIATFNENKYREIEKAFEHLNIELLSLKNFQGEIPEAPETGESFAENARQKAEFYSKFFKGRPVLAEDSGLVVPSLDGYPGIHSARIAHDDQGRIDSVLTRLQNPSKSSSRFAYYVCSMHFLSGDHQISVEARCEGTIVKEPKGNSGFGYDPIFQPEGSNKTFGQMTVQEKSQYSHRARAAAKISPAIQKEFS
jgi:XTP/dITP diphosphohydrolase